MFTDEVCAVRSDSAEYLGQGPREVGAEQQRARGAGQRGRERGEQLGERGSGRERWARRGRFVALHPHAGDGGDQPRVALGPVRVADVFFADVTLSQLFQFALILDLVYPLRR